jgi:hypothetical protein
VRSLSEHQSDLGASVSSSIRRSFRKVLTSSIVAAAGGDADVPGTFQRVPGRRRGFTQAESRVRSLSERRKWRGGVSSQGKKGREREQPSY